MHSSSCYRTQKMCEKVVNTCLFMLDGDYLIPFCRDEISTLPAGTDFTLRLHGEINFQPGKAGQILFWYFFIKTHRSPLI